MEFVKKLEQIFIGVNAENIESSSQAVMNMFDSDYPFSFNFLISRLLYSMFISKTSNKNVCIQYLLSLKKQNDKLVDIFSKYLLQLETAESYFLLQNMIEKGLIDSALVDNLNTLYFSQFKTEEEIKRIKNSHDKPHFYDEFFSAFDELSKNDWELHKKYVEEGDNPNEISKIIRNDEIEKLQKLSSQTEFNFNQTIKPSLYERYSFVNKKNVVTLIDYAAFFGSVKCFKYLLMNGAKVGNTGKYAIAGGNIEIIHLCEQNNISFEGAYETAIKFHKNDVFKYVYDNKLEKNPLQKSQKRTRRKDPLNINDDFGILCIDFGNYEILSFLIEEGLRINDSIINESARTGNLYLVKHFLQNNKITSDILVKSVESGNVELIIYIMNHYKIGINAKDVHLFSSMFTLVI